MSTPDSGLKVANNSRGLAAQAEERFLGLDHVGHVRHFEGINLQDLIAPIRTVLEERTAKFEDATEQVRGRSVYTNIAALRPEGPLTLWVTATQVEGVGTLLDAKVFHPTESSAEADEQLSLLVDELQRRMLKTG